MDVKKTNPKLSIVDLTHLNMSEFQKKPDARKIKEFRVLSSIEKSKRSN